MMEQEFQIIYHLPIKYLISNQKIFKIADGGKDDIANVTIKKNQKVN